MAKFKLLAFNNPVEGREDEYNDWYTNTHLPDVMRVPGIHSGQRFRLADVQREGTSRHWKYLAIYDCEAEDLQQLFEVLDARVGTPEMRMSSALAEQRLAWYFEPITELIRHGT